MKKLTLLSVCLLLGVAAQAQNAFGEVMGTVLSSKDNSPIYNAKVKTESNGSVYQALTDFDGKFRISAIPAGDYHLQITYMGDTMHNVLAKIPIDGIANLKTIPFRQTTELEVVDFVYNPDKLTLAYGVTPEIKLSAEDIKNSPVKFNQTDLIKSMSSEIKVSDDGELMFRGSRKGDMIYMMDGVKTTSITNIPSSAIGGMMVYTGGIPAKYGDTTGGVVVMESKSYFDLYREWNARRIREEKKKK